jgi:hypothetical protein
VFSGTTPVSHPNDDLLDRASVEHTLGVAKWGVLQRLSVDSYLTGADGVALGVAFLTPTRRMPLSFSAARGAGSGR